MLDRAEQRRTNFFRGTKRDPEMHAIPEALEAQALTTIETNIRAQADAEGRPIDTAKVKQALAVAQRLLRQLPREQIQSIAASGGLLQSITAQSLAGATTQVAGDKSDPRTLPDGSGTGRDSGATLLRFGDGARMSGARFSEIGGNPSTEVARNIELARQQAIHLGMPWAANNPELLKLGPTAIKALADVQLREHSFSRLTKEGHFKAKDVVTLAEFAKAKGIKDANQLAGTMTDEVRLGRTLEEQQRIKDAEVGYMRAATAAANAPDNAAAQAALEAAAKHRKKVLAPIAARGEHERDVIRKNEEQMRMRQEDRVAAPAAERKADVKEQKADVKEQKADEAGAANFGDLDGPTSAGPKKDATAPSAAPAATTTGSPPAKASLQAKPPTPK